MATEQTTAEAEAEDKRRPYVVVLMSEDMKAALKKWSEDNGTNPTALLRRLAADKIGYALEDEPQPTSRAKYNSQDERDAAHKLASKKSGLLRKALFQVHNALQNSKPQLQAAASDVVMALSERNRKFDMVELEALDLGLDAAAKAGK